MSNVRKILCHAEFFCGRCGKPYLCMGLADWLDEKGVVADAVRLDRDICNDCDGADRKAEREAYNLSRKQAAWVRRHTPPPKPHRR